MARPPNAAARLDAAFDRLGDTGSSDGDPGWSYWLDEAQAHEMAGNAYLRLGDWNRPATT